jgi:hypothetical protein
MNTLIILTLLIGHLWADHMIASDMPKADESTQDSAVNNSQKAKDASLIKGTPNVKGMITKAVIPKDSEHSSVQDNRISHKSESAKQQHSEQLKTDIDHEITKEPVQRLIPLEPSTKISSDSTSPTKANDKGSEKSIDHDQITSSDTSSEVSNEDDETSLEVSIDTVGVEAGGNWLSKRVWYEQSQDLLPQIAHELSAILGMRQHYLTTRDTIDDALDKAFDSLGFDRARLSSMLESLLSSLKEEQSERGDLSSGERDLRLNIKKQQNELEQLQLDLQALKNLDDALDAAVDRVIEQINLAQSYHKEAQSYFEQIPNVNEQRAKELYYKIDTLYKDMIAIKGYLSGQLYEYLKNVESNATMHIAKIKSQMAAIQSKGIDFQKQLRIFEGEDIPVIQERDSDEHDQDENKKTDLFGFFAIIRNWFSGILSSFWDWITHLF